MSLVALAILITLALAVFVLSVLIYVKSEQRETLRMKRKL